MRLLAAAAAFVLSAAAAPPASIQFESGVFRVTDWSPPPVAPAKGWISVLAVYAGPGDVPPLLGTYAVENRALIFRPQFPIAPGVQYRVIFHPPAGGAAVERTFSGPARETTTSTRVAAVYPSGDVLPSNQLRLYIYFSAPMSQSEAGGHMRLLDESGREVAGAFLPGEELWDPGFRRLTMTLDPGRIKRGLTSNRAIGPAIVEGRRYTLVIDREWPDARGVALVAGFRKSFRGRPAQRTPRDPKQWTVMPPKAGSTAPLTVSFPTPMNYVLLQRMLRVSNGKEAVDGVISVERAETVWIFRPRRPWTSGAYSLIVGSALEDLAGNHIGQPFDIDVFERVTEHIERSMVSLPFQVK